MIYKIFNVLRLITLQKQIYNEISKLKLFIFNNTTYFRFNIKLLINNNYYTNNGKYKIENFKNIFSFLDLYYDNNLFLISSYYSNYLKD